MKRIWWSAVLLLSLSTWVGSAGASLSHRDWTVRLLNNTHSVSAAEPIRLELPQSLPTPVRAALHFELDDVSITDAIVFDAGVATYRPIQPLAEGSHRLRLVYAPDRGRWRELGVWQFAVKQDSDTGGDATAVTSKRAVTPFGAFAELELEVADDEVKESDREDSPEKFLATLRAGQMQARVGPQKLAYNSLIHKDLDRPGAVAEWDLGEQIQIRGFGVSSQADSGYKRLVGTDDARYQLNGVLVEQQLPSYGDNQFSMVSGWVSGTARSKGSEQHGGSAWSVAGNASMLSNQLRLHAEYAGSEFEWDRSAADTKEVDAGQAYAMSMEYHAAEDAPHKWHVGTQYSEVTPWFGSLGNPTLSTDRINLRTYGGITVDEWQFDAAVDRRRNNLEEDPSRPVIITDKLQLATIWSPTEAPFFDVLGKPSYKVASEFGKSHYVATSDNSAAQDPLQRSIDLSLQSEFAHDEWLWGMRAKGGRAPGKIDAATSAGIRTMGFDVYGDISAGLPLSVKPALSWQRKRDAATGTTADKWRAGISSSAITLRHDLQANFDVAYQSRSRSDDVDNDSVADVGANLVWTLQQPSSTRRGLALAFSGNVLHGNPAVRGSEDEPGYSFMVSLSTDNPLGSW